MTRAGYERMAVWSLLALVAYGAALQVSSPQLQTLLWKVGHVTMAAHLGYGLDRSFFRDRITAASPPLLHLRRAIVVSAAILGIALGM